MSKRERTPTSKDFVPLMLRLPPDLHEWLKAQSENERRSLNSQVAVMLQSLRDDDKRTVTTDTPT